MATYDLLDDRLSRVESALGTLDCVTSLSIKEQVSRVSEHVASKLDRYKSQLDAAIKTYEEFQDLVGEHGFSKSRDDDSIILKKQIVEDEQCKLLDIHKLLKEVNDLKGFARPITEHQEHRGRLNQLKAEHLGLRSEVLIAHERVLRLLRTYHHMMAILSSKIERWDAFLRHLEGDNTPF